MLALSRRLATLSVGAHVPLRFNVARTLATATESAQVQKPAEQKEKSRPFIVYNKYPITLTGKYVVPPRNGMTVEKFLQTIGQGAQDHLDKFPTWDALFRAHCIQLKLKGVPIQTRKYILNWVAKYREGVEPHPLRKTNKRVDKAKKKKILKEIASGKRPKSDKYKKFR
eukprot:Colp12_sorted_trinity150504_noHs@19846